MKFFLKNTLLGIAVQLLLGGVSLLVFWLFDLPEDSWLIVWGRIYSPTIILVMGLFMIFSSIRNLALALALGVLLGATLYGAIFSLLVRFYRNYRELNQTITSITHETNPPEKIID
jgi:hypothetical protein